MLNKTWTSTSLSFDQHPLLVPKKPLAPQLQSDLLKIVELIRLKSSWVRLSTSNEKIKPNLRLCIHVAKQLQQLVDSATDGQGSVTSSDETQVVPKEK